MKAVYEIEGFPFPGIRLGIDENKNPKLIEGPKGFTIKDVIPMLMELKPDELQHLVDAAIDAKNKA
jgi:hypothetical protein